MDRSLCFLKLLGSSLGLASIIPLMVEIQVTFHEKKTEHPVIWLLVWSLQDFKILCFYREFSRISACLTSCSLICCPLQDLYQSCSANPRCPRNESKEMLPPFSSYPFSCSTQEEKGTDTPEKMGNILLRKFLCLICFHSNNLLFFPAGEVYTGLPV